LIAFILFLAMSASPPAVSPAQGSAPSGGYAASEAAAPAAAVAVTPAVAEPATFAMADGDSDDEEASVEASASADALQFDLRPPEIPPAPDTFTQEDHKLRDELLKFYAVHNPENALKVNVIVGKFRRGNVSNLWAQLAVKYDIRAVVGVDLLANTLYLDSAFEHSDADTIAKLDARLVELNSEADKSKRFLKAMEGDAANGSDEIVRTLGFRGIPDDMRPTIWQVMLGYLPMARQADWNAIKGEKRALYASYREEFLTVSGDQLSVKQTATASLDEDLMQEIRQDVDRTRHDMEFFRGTATCNSLIGMLFVYARLNPGVRYVQGMNEVAAILFYVMSSSAAEFAEADAFWCFTELMGEIKDGFIQAMDNTEDGVHAITGSVARLLESYDPEVALHINDAGLPPLVWAFRWCSVMFAQDLPLPDVMRLWDSLIADPRRYELVIYTAVAAVLLMRDELLGSDKPFTLGELLQHAPKNKDFDTLWRYSLAICAFERRAQPPQFPPPRPERDKLREAAEKAEEMARAAAARAQEVTAAARQHVQEQIAPVVMERASQAKTVAKQASQDMVAGWQDSAPARKEALEKAQTHLTSIWSTVSTKAADAKLAGQKMAADYANNPEASGGPASGGRAAAGTIGLRASAALSAAAAAWNSPALGSESTDPSSAAASTISAAPAPPPAPVEAATETAPTTSSSSASPPLSASPPTASEAATSAPASKAPAAAAKAMPATASPPVMSAADIAELGVEDDDI